MAANYQRAALNRKLIYFGVIVVLFIVTVLVRGVVAQSLIGDAKWTIAQQAKDLEMTESSQAESELSGSAVRLLLTGSRGLAICALWVSAQEKQKKHEWNQLELRVRSITKLQPHFLTPWLFQSWNLAYNVSVEMDNLTDMYFYIARGINLLAEGESINRNSPDMRHMIAFYYQNKFGVSDKVTTLRSLLELSCVPPEERDHRLLRRGKIIDPVEFKTFCEKHPRLIRRLRELPIRTGKNREGGDVIQYLCSTPEDIVRFLEANEQLPTRYKDRKELFDNRLSQFPVLPPPFTGGKAELVPNQRIYDGDADAMCISRGWYAYALEAAPVPNPVPAPAPRNYVDKERKRRVPRSPALIIFMQGPPRAQSYVAEWLQKEGWFDKDPWVVDEFKSQEIKAWFPGQSVALNPTATSQDAWNRAFEMWDSHGKANGLNLTQEEQLRYRSRAAIYANARGASVDGPAPEPRPEDLNDPLMKEAYEAHAALTYLRTNLQITQFEGFFHGSLLEQRPETVRLRKRLYQAERIYRLTLDRALAMEIYQAVFKEWMDLFRAEPKFRTHSERVQEEVYEHQIRYQRMERDRDLPKFVQQTRNIVGPVVPLVHAQRAIFGMKLPDPQTRNAVGMFFPLAHNAQVVPVVEELQPFWFDGFFDGNDPTGTPWINPGVKERVKNNLGIKRPSASSSDPPMMPKQ